MWATTENGTGNAVKASSRGSEATWCVSSPPRLPLSSFFSHCVNRRGERRRDDPPPGSYANIHAISELIDRALTKRRPIFPILFPSSSLIIYHFSFASIDPIDRRKVKSFLRIFKYLTVSVSVTRFNVLIKFFETLFTS